MKRISRLFKPDKYYYRIGNKKLYYKPEGSRLLYWELDDKGQYCGILRYKVGILITVLLFVILFILFKIGTGTSGVINVQAPYVVRMEDNLLALNMNSTYLESDDISYRVICDDIILTSGVLRGGASIGTVRVSSTLSDGDYPAIIEYQLGDKKKRVNILLRVR